MAGFPPRFGTGMSPMAGTQPVAPTPTLPGLQPPMGGVPPVGSPIPLNSSNSGIAGYGGSSSGRDKFSKYLQKMNTTAPLAMNRGGPVRMSHGGSVQQPIADQQRFLPPMNLSAARPAVMPSFGGYGGGGGIQGALQPLSSYITTQLQQQASQEVGPFIDEVAGNAQETFGLQSGGMTAIAQPAITQIPYNNRLPSGYGGGLMPFMNKSPALNGPYNPMSRGNEDVLFHQNNTATGGGNYAANFNQGGAVPRQTMIEDQPHMLAYIDPQEQSMLRQMGGSGQPGPGGVPAYARRDGPGSENFGAEARDFRDELDRQEEEQRQNDADDRAAAEAALRAATEQRIAAQYPSADEIEVMNTAGYDKEPTQYPTASRDSYAGFGGGQLFSNRGGLEQPFSRDNRPMTNLGNPASDFLNAESAEGTFANTGGTSSIFDDGVRDRMSNIFGGNTVNAGTSGISIPKFSSSNFTGDGGNLESSDVGYLGGSSKTGGLDTDPVTARSNLAKRMESLDGLALARSKLGFPERTDALSSSGAYVDSMGDRISDNRALPDDMLFAAPQEFKNRSISPFDFDPSDPNTSGNIMSSGSSGLTSGLMTGDPFAPTKDSRGYMPYNPETDDFVRDDMSGFKTELQNSINEFEKRKNELEKANIPSNDMFGTEDLANQTPTPTGFGFDEDGEGFDSSVMYSDLSEAELEQLSLDGDEGASNALRARNDDQNARELDAFERDRASKGFSTRPATSMAPPKDDARIFPTPSPLVGGPLDSEDAGFDVFATDTRADRPTGGSSIQPLAFDSIDSMGIGDPIEKFPSDTKRPDDQPITFDNNTFEGEFDGLGPMIPDDAEIVYKADIPTGGPFQEDAGINAMATDTRADVPTGGSSIQPLGDPVDPMGIGDPAVSFDDFGSEQAGGYEEEALVNDINSEFQGEGGEGLDLEETISNAVTGGFPDENEIENKGIVKLEQLIANAGNGQNGDVTAGTIKAVKEDLNNDLYYNKLDGLSEGNYAFETKEELLKRLRAGERNQGWVRDGVSLISKAHPILALLDKVMIKLTQKDMKEQADLLDGDKRGYLKDGQTATAVRIQKGRHKGKYVGVVIKDAKGNIVEYKGHSVMPNQFDNKDPLYDYILGEGFKPGPDDDDSPAPNDPCPAGYVLSGGVCVPVQNVGEDDETTEDDTDDTSEDETPTETLDEIIARIKQPSRVPTEPTETFNPITFANKGGAMGVDPLTSGAVTDSLASATQRFLSSLTG